MKSYTVNKVTYDYLEIFLTYTNEEFEVLSSKVIENAKDNDYYFKEDENLFKNSIYLSYLFDLVMDDILKIDFKIKFDIIYDLPLDIKVLENRALKEKNIILSLPILNDEIKLSFPSFKDLKKIDEDKKDELIKEAIDIILLSHNLKENIEINEATKDSIIYADVYGKDVKIYDYGIYSNDYFLSSFENLKVGEEVTLFNVKMNNSKINTKITKIYKVVPLTLTDDLVDKLNFLGIKDKDTFLSVFKEKYFKTMDFTNSIMNIYSYIIDKSDIRISKVLFDFVEMNSFFEKIDKNTKEEKYNQIKFFIIQAFLEKLYYNKDGNIKYDTKYLESYFEDEYKIMELINNINLIPFDAYLDARMQDAYLYTFIKNGGFKND